MRVDKNFYPGFVRKAITFTIDDGNIELDKHFISIVKPHGIRGTFNLCSPNLKSYTADFYRELYSGFGISNHCKFHPFALTPDKERAVADEPFNAESANKSLLYKTDREGVYHFYSGTRWCTVASSEAYCRLVSECHRELEAIFGKGSITTYVWPYFEQNDDIVKDYLTNKFGYTAVRKTGEVKDSTGYSLPAAREAWSYNTGNKNLLAEAEKYESYTDDGELKFFAFGVHSHDFENDNNWCDLERFAEKYGNRESEFWYASVEEIFSYADATLELIVSDTAVKNPTDVRLYVKIDGEERIIEPNSEISI